MFFFFVINIDTHYRETYVERMPGEKENDRNDRAIRVASTWYSKHISLSFCTNKDNIKIVLLTDDADNLKKAYESGIIASTGIYICFNHNNYP